MNSLQPARHWTNIEHSAKSSATTPSTLLPIAPGFGLLPTTDEVQVGQSESEDSSEGAAGGLSGMTTEHLRPLLEDGRGLRLLGDVAERLARAEVPAEVLRLVRGGRLTALSKPDGGVRGILAGDVIRRLVARTMSQQLAKAAEVATGPHQHALSTRAGCECVAHALQGLVEMDPDTTIVSDDGIGAYDLISRESMMTGFFRMERGGAALPFVQMFYGLLSENL